MSIKSRIQELCKEAGISVKDAEIGSGLSVGTIGRWNESTPSVDKVVKVSLFFDVSVDYLVGLTDEKKPTAGGGDGLSDVLREFINLLPSLTPQEVSVLLATAKAQVAARKAQDSQE